jgi:hypothetical protein
VTVTSTALPGGRVVESNRLPDFDTETSSSGLARRLSMTQAADPLRGDSPFDSVTVRFVESTGQVLSAAVVIAPDPSAPVGSTNYYATCSPCSGVSVDLAARTIRFDDTPLAATLLSSSAAPATLTGRYRLPDWRPRSGTTKTAAALSACNVTQNLVSAGFPDIACLAGTYVGTGIDGQACIVSIDATAQTFRFDDGVQDNTFAYAASGGFSNLASMRSPFTQSARMSRPNVPLESIELQVSPVAANARLLQVDLRNIHAIGGTLNSVYYRSCRLEFDLGGP